MSRIRLAGAFLTAWAIVFVAGCGDDTGGRLAITGSVDYKGVPLDQGSIEFLPHPGVKTQAGATITNGRYSIPADKGLEPGMYTVKISSIEGPDVSVEPGGLPGKEPKERLPAKYNTKSTLTKEVKKGETKFDFQLD
jgi:hypothetical protein